SARSGGPEPTVLRAAPLGLDRAPLPRRAARSPAIAKRAPAREASRPSHGAQPARAALWLVPGVAKCEEGGTRTDGAPGGPARTRPRAASQARGAVPRDREASAGSRSEPPLARSAAGTSRSLARARRSEVRGGGLEPPQCYPLAPQASASTNSAIPARWREI